MQPRTVGSLLQQPRYDMNRQSCSWCHASNVVWMGRPNYCHQCGHRADQVRSACNCPQCVPPAPAAVPRALLDPTPRTRIEGRGFSAPEFEWHCSAEGVTLHVDDAANPEAWVQVTINLVTLADLLEQVLKVQDFTEIAAAAGVKNDDAGEQK